MLPSSRQQQSTHLACRPCQKKKIKCDRNLPCTQCTRAGIPCKASTRKPRAKTSKTGDAELRERILKLEKLVETFSGEDGQDRSRTGSNANSLLDESSTSPQADHASASPASPSPTRALDTSKYVASTFWSSLTAEVKALADVFTENGSNDGDSPEDSPHSSNNLPEASQAVTTDFELIFCPPGVLYVMPGALSEPDPFLASQLFTSYLNFVEPMFKVFHVPSLKALMLDGQPYLGQPCDAPCNRAVKAAIFFAGANSCSDEECLVFGKSRRELANDFRRKVDIALYQAHPLNSTELATLQALTVYVGSIRVLDTSRRAWTMVALLDRIGRSLGIHQEFPGESIYLRELRRRLWYSVIFLDCFASMDRGTDPTIMPNSYNRPLPSNVNDDDFDEYSTTLNCRTNELTDMSLALMAHDGSIIPFREKSGLANLLSEPWQQQLQKAYELQTRMQERYFRHCDPANPYHQTLRYTGIAIVHCMFLRSVRPLQYDSSAPPPRVDSPWVMDLALNILRHSSQMWAHIAGIWRRMPWVPWHAIAVVLAGLCSVRGTDIANEAWQLVDNAMVRYAPLVADGPNGMLWRPIEKLYKKAVAFRDGLDSPKPLQTQYALPATQGMSEPYRDTQIVAQDPAASIMPVGDFRIDIADPMFDISSDMMASLPNDTSWLDWESIVRDIDEVKAEDMQWI